MNGVTEIQEHDFQDEVLNAEIPVLMDFYAPWCGPCRALAPALEGIAKAYDGRLKVVKVNIAEAQQLAYAHGVRAVPTLMIFKDGKLVDTMVGVPPAQTLRSKLDAAAAPVGFGVCSVSKA